VDAPTFNFTATAHSPRYNALYGQVIWAGPQEEYRFNDDGHQWSLKPSHFGYFTMEFSLPYLSSEIIVRPFYGQGFSYHAHPLDIYFEGWSCRYKPQGPFPSYAEAFEQARSFVESVGYPLPNPEGPSRSRFDLIEAW
jgi:hypothetical protein